MKIYKNVVDKEPEYKTLEKHTGSNEYGYINCMFDACKKVGLKDVIIYSDGYEYYEGTMDIHIEAKLNDYEFYFYLRQDYGSCSYCDWLQDVGVDEVVNKYVKDLKEAIDSL
jgi:hypothetical protein